MTTTMQAPRKRVEYRRFDLKPKEPAKCFKCLLSGHFARDCPGVTKPVKKDDDAISEKSTACSESTNTTKRPYIQALPCMICGDLGHRTGQCRKMRCDECEALGHFARDCPKRIERQETEHREYLAREARRREAARRQSQREQQRREPQPKKDMPNNAADESKCEATPPPTPPALTDTNLFPALPSGWP